MLQRNTETHITQLCLQIKEAAQLAAADPERAGAAADSAFHKLTAGQRERLLQSREIDELKIKLHMVRPRGGSSSAAFRQPALWQAPSSMTVTTAGKR